MDPQQNGHSKTDWTQTKTDLTIAVRLPHGSGARDVTCIVAHERVSIGLRSGEELLSGELWGAVSGSVWSVEGELLSLELEKAKAQYWPCALHGDPEIDVAELIAKDKRDREPAYKPPPDAGATPQRVTDKETIRQLKAEFPQLDLPLGQDTHTATHRNYAGPRKTFDWGPIPTEPAAQPVPTPGRANVDMTAVSPASHTAAPLAASSSMPPPPSTTVRTVAPANTARQSAGKYTWGALPPAAPPVEDQGFTRRTGDELDKLIDKPSSGGAPESLNGLPHVMPTLPEPPASTSLPAERQASLSQTPYEEAQLSKAPPMYQWGALPKS